MKRRTGLLLMCALLICALSLGALAAKPPQPTIRLGGKLGWMKAGSAVTLRPRLSGVDRSALTFSSSDTGVASVSAEGRIQALAPGRAVITVAGGGAKEFRFVRTHGSERPDADEAAHDGSIDDHVHLL